MPVLIYQNPLKLTLGRVSERFSIHIPSGYCTLIKIGLWDKPFLFPLEDIAGRHFEITEINGTVVGKETVLFYHLFLKIGEISNE